MNENYRYPCALLIFSLIASVSCGSPDGAIPEESSPNAQVQPLNAQQSSEADAHVAPDELGHAVAKIRCTWLDGQYADRETCERELGSQIGQVFAQGSCITAGGTLDAASAARCETGFKRAKFLWDHDAMLLFAAQLAITVKVDCASEVLCGLTIEDLEKLEKMERIKAD